MKRVVLGMSGGVDSSVAAALLVEQGYEVQGVTLQTWESEDGETVSKKWQERGCCKVGIARFVAERLDIPHRVVDIKEQVWKRAEDIGLPADEIKESQEICFVTKGDYRSFLTEQAPEAERPGIFVGTNGQPLGTHRGAAFYTPGQRRGLGVASEQRLY